MIVSINAPEVKGKLSTIYGADGKSAYEIACDNGFVGTEEEWLASLKGYELTEHDKDEITTKVIEDLPIYDGEVEFIEDGDEVEY